MMAITQAKKPAFKKPFRLVKTFQVTPLAARGMSPAGLAASSMQLGITAAGYTPSKKHMHVESPSPGASDWQRTEHQGRDTTKKTSQSLAKRDDKDSARGRSWTREHSEDGGRSWSTSWHPSDKESDKDQMGSKHKSKSSSEHEKAASKGKGGTPAKGQGSGQAGPSHDNWLALPTAPIMPRMKHVVPSKSLKKVEPKMVHQMMVQQQARQPMPSRVYLPSAPTGAKHYQTSKKNIDSLSQEWDHLGREVRAVQALYTTTGVHGQQMSVLMQPVQASGITALAVLQIQLQELCLKNAGTMLKDQALAQNLIFFGERMQTKGAERKC